MVKIIKSYKLGTAQDAQGTAKSSKGAVSTPFTQQEYNQLTQAGEWTGGYVEAMGYVAPPMMDGGDDGSGISDDGTAIYPGIHVNDGSSSFSNYFVDSDKIYLDISVEWREGWTGNDLHEGAGNLCHPIPNWHMSYISSYVGYGAPYNYTSPQSQYVTICNTVSSVNVISTKWVKASNGVYKVEIKVSYLLTTYSITVNPVTGESSQSPKQESTKNQTLSFNYDSNSNSLT